MSGFTAIEGRVLGMGTVSGTDETPISLYEPTHAIRIFLENPVTVNNAPVYLTGVTSLNTTASGLVDIVGDGATSVTTLGNVITISSPFALGNSALVGTGGTTITSGTNTTLISSQIDKALAGTDGITIVSGSNTVTIQGFRTEFVSASGFLQTQIDSAEGSDVDSVNAVVGSVLVTGTQNVTTQTVGQTITITGPDLTPYATTAYVNSVADEIEPAIISANNLIVVTSGASTTTLTADTTPQFVSVEATTITGTTVQVGGVLSAHTGTFGQSLTISGVPVSAGPKVDSLNSLTGVVTLAQGTNITITPAGNTLTIASTAGGGGGGGNALIGTGGITITSGTNTTQISSQVDKAWTGAGSATIISGTNLNIVSAGVPNSLIGTGGTTVTSGTNTTQISSQIDKAWVGAGGATVISGTNTNILSSRVANAVEGAGGFTVVSGTNKDIYNARVSNAIVGLGGITVISGVNTTSISSAAGGSAIIGDSFISVNSGTNTISLAADAIVGSSFISVNSGTNTVTLTADAIVGTINNAVVVSGSSTVTISGMVTVVSGIAYAVDTTRGGKSLSTSRQNYSFSSNGGADNSFLDVGAAVNADAGWVMPRNGTIVSYSAYYPTGTATKTFEIRKNNSAVTLDSVVVTAASVFYDDQVNTDINRGDRLQVFATAAGGAAQDPTFLVEVAWRLS